MLRRFVADDVNLLTELDADPRVTFFITGGLPEFDRTMLLRWMADYERWPNLGTWAAEVRGRRQFIGWFHLRPQRGRRDHLELGYRLRQSAWGMGYATEGSRALVAHALGALGAARVVAYAMAVHAGSRRVMEKAGLRYVRTFHEDWPYRIPGDEQGDVEYAITREEWNLSRPQGARAGM
jgi:RimJ/RimL family protein N-acetyltransferase